MAAAAMALGVKVAVTRGEEMAAEVMAVEVTVEVGKVAVEEGGETVVVVLAVEARQAAAMEAAAMAVGSTEAAVMEVEDVEEAM
eukprot:2640388-Pleurochrysis_carterae.AAC.1